MGKTSKPISILCIGLEETAELVALKEQCHIIHYALSGYLPPLNMNEYDVIIGPKCWRWLPGVSEKWLPQLLKEVRAAQPPRVKKVKGKKNDTV